MDRSEARKNVLNSGHRALSMGHVKWSVWVQKNIKMVKVFLDVGAEITTRYC